MKSEVNALPDQGTVFFVVHSVIDGENVYEGNVESSFKVEKAEETPGFGTGLALLAVAVIAGMIVATRSKK